MATPALVIIGPSDAPHARCMLGVFNALKNANLPGIQWDSSGAQKDWQQIQIWADLRTVPPLPCVLITIDGLQEEEWEEGNGFKVKGVMYPVNVFVVAREGWEDHSRLTMYLNWRHQLMEMLRDKTRLAEVHECVDIALTPKAIVEKNTASGEGGETYNLIQSSFGVKVFCTLDAIKEVVNP